MWCCTFRLEVAIKSGPSVLRRLIPGLIDGGSKQRLGVRKPTPSCRQVMVFIFLFPALLLDMTTAHFVTSASPSKTICTSYTIIQVVDVPFS